MSVRDPIEAGSFYANDNNYVRKVISTTGGTRRTARLVYREFRKGDEVAVSQGECSESRMLHWGKQIKEEQALKFVPNIEEQERALIKQHQQERRQKETEVLDSIPDDALVAAMEKRGYSVNKQADQNKNGEGVTFTDEGTLPEQPAEVAAGMDDPASP